MAEVRWAPKILIPFYGCSTVTHLLFLLSQLILPCIWHCFFSKLRHSWEDRQAHAASLMECVRFPLLTGEELVDVVEKEEFMSSDPACHRLILEAYQYAILPNRQHLMQTSRTQVSAKAYIDIHLI